MDGNSNYELYREIHGTSAPEVLLLLLGYVYLLAASTMPKVNWRTGVKQWAVEFNRLSVDRQFADLMQVISILFLLFQVNLQNRIYKT